MIRVLYHYLRCGFEDASRPPAAPDPRPPRADAANGLHALAPSVQKRRVNLETHEERVDAVAPRDQHPRPGRKPLPSDQPLRPLRKSLRNLRVDAQYGLMPHLELQIQRAMIDTPPNPSIREPELRKTDLDLSLDLFSSSH